MNADKQLSRERKMIEVTPRSLKIRVFRVDSRLLFPDLRSSAEIRGY